MEAVSTKASNITKGSGASLIRGSGASFFSGVKDSGASLMNLQTSSSSQVHGGPHKKSMDLINEEVDEGRHLQKTASQNYLLT